MTLEAAVEKVRVVVQAADPISQAGLTRFLGTQERLAVLPAEQRASTDVVVVAVDRLSGECAAVLRRAAQETRKPVVLVSQELTETELLTAVECGVVAVVPRLAATGERLVAAVRIAASGGGALPSKMQGELLSHLERLQREVLGPTGLNTSGFTQREIDVLRLMADGKDTEEIAEVLCYSERTVKNVIYGVTSRLNLRNRPHAVAYALRAGMI